MRRRKRKQRLTPKAARTHKALCALPRDHVDTRNHWFMVGEKRVFIYAQRTGHAHTGRVEMPRRTFEMFARWYATGR